ncbi:MAG: hypothetical protein HQK49_03005 [Oligoflexia bacterium]|nr:hypothetical protein [Oligoflexia bacterium]
MKNIFYELRQNLHRESDPAQLKMFKNRYAAALFEHSLWYLGPERIVENKSQQIAVKNATENATENAAKNIVGNAVENTNKKNRELFVTEYARDLSLCKRCLKLRAFLYKKDHLNHLNHLNHHSDYKQQLSNNVKIYFLNDFFSENNFVDRSGMNSSQSDHLLNFPQVFSEEKEILFSRILQAMNIEKTDMFLSSFVKCRPIETDKMDDKNLEMLANNCMEFTKREIILFKPKVVATFGAYVSGFLIGRKERLSLIHGKFIRCKFSYGNLVHECEVVPLFSLDYLLINPQMKRVFWDDIKRIIIYLNRQ